MYLLYYIYWEKKKKSKMKEKITYGPQLHPHQCGSERQTATKIHPHMSAELSWSQGSLVVDDMPSEQSAHQLKHDKA